MEFKAIGWNMVGISEFLSHSDPFGYIWIWAQLASELETGVSIYICLLDLLWKTGFAQRRYHALSNELCFPFLK